jgi:hypothetical protein
MRVGTHWLVVLVMLGAGCDHAVQEVPPAPAVHPDMAHAPMDAGTPPSRCGEQTFAVTVTRSSPNILMVVDESGSMRETFPGTTQVKWDSLKSAATSLLNNYSGMASWGLSIFPHPSNEPYRVMHCDAGQIDVPLAVGAEQSILAAMSSLGTPTGRPQGDTPTAPTLMALQPSFTDTAHNNYVVLMTDGMPTCPDAQGKIPDVATAIAALYAGTPSVRTFLVAIGREFQWDDPMTWQTRLDGWAVAGHTQRMTGKASDPLFYQADNVTDLDAAFADIVTGVTSCVFNLQDRPADPGLLTTTLDGKPLAADPVNGATYDAATQSLVLHGAACTAVSSGKANKVDVTYGCPPPPIPTQDPIP